MRLAGGFQKLDGRTALAVFAVPAFAAGWALMSAPSETSAAKMGGGPAGKTCDATRQTGLNEGRASAGGGSRTLQYRNGEVQVAPGPRALTAEWIWLKMREARMIAERSDRGDLDLGPELAKYSNDPAWVQAIASERAILRARRATHYGFERELGKRLAQIRKEHDALMDLAQGRKRERDLLSRELDSIAYLHKRGLATTGRLVSLQRDMERLKADQSQLELDAERALSRAGEVELELLRRNSDRQIEIADGLRMIETRFAEIEDMRGGAGPDQAVGVSAPGASGDDGELILAAAEVQPCSQGE